MITVYEVLYDTAMPGPAGDGTQIRRFLELRKAETFAKLHTCYGSPAAVGEAKVAQHIAKRWGLL